MVKKSLTIGGLGQAMVGPSPKSPNCARASAPNEPERRLDYALPSAAPVHAAQGGRFRRPNEPEARQHAAPPSGRPTPTPCCRTNPRETGITLLPSHLRPGAPSTRPPPPGCRGNRRPGRTPHLRPPSNRPPNEPGPQRRGRPRTAGARPRGLTRRRHLDHADRGLGQHHAACIMIGEKCADLMLAAR